MKEETDYEAKQKGTYCYFCGKRHSGMCEKEKKHIKDIATEVQIDFGMGGLADGLYLDFATEVTHRVLEEFKKT